MNIYIYNTCVSLEPRLEHDRRSCLHGNQPPRVAALRAISNSFLELSLD